MKIKVSLCAVQLACIAILNLTSTQAAIVTIDFTKDDSGNLLTHGQVISTAPDVQNNKGNPDSFFEFGNIVSVRTTQGTGGHEGAVIFDSTPGGPGGILGDPDNDLLVDLGNIMTLQDTQRPATTDTGAGANGLVFDAPDDVVKPNAGSIIFDFVDPVAPLAVDIVDANGKFEMVVILTDENSNTRTYTILEKWTYEISAPGIPPTAKGFDTLFLNSVAPQDGEGPGADGVQGNADDFTLVVDAGLDQSKVTNIEFYFKGNPSSSGGFDNLVLDGVDPNKIPEPSAIVVAAFATTILAVVVRRAMA